MLEKAPTPEMIEFLMDCHEKELMNLPPCKATVKYAHNLIKRKMLVPFACWDANGKKMLCVRTTQLGRDYLSTLV